MQKKILIALFTLLLLGVGWVLASLLSHEDSQARMNYEYLSPSENIEVDKIQKNSWAKDLANPQAAKFSFPVNELFMQIDLKKYVPPKVRFFRVVIDRADRYSLFCIVQTLSSMNLPYVVQTEGKAPTVYVSSKEKAPLGQVVEKLKEYDIESKIIEVWL